MNTASEISEQLIKHIKQQGWQVTIVSIASVKDLETEIGARRQKGLLDPVLFDEYLASFDFSCAHRLADAQSLIIVGVPQPQVRVVRVGFVERRHVVGGRQEIKQRRLAGADVAGDGDELALTGTGHLSREGR